MKTILTAILTLCILTSCSGEPDLRPNIVLVSVDTLRWDYLSPFGYPDSTHTPAATRLADNGVVFENAVATAGTTVPSHGSMMTGLYPRMHGARSNFNKKYPAAHTVAEALRDAGYSTGAFVSAAFLIHRGLGAGFDTDNTPFKDPVRGVRPQLGHKTVGQAIEWLNSIDQTQPVFMWLHLWEPHGPYLPTDWSMSRLGDYDGFLKDGMTIEHARTRVRDIVGDPEHLQALRTHYAGEVNLVDQYLGRFLDHLDAQGMLENTVVIFVADHGQALGEAGRMGHGAMHIETVIRVPLIVADFRKNTTARVQTRVGTVDIAPTIAALTGLDKTFNYAGRSLLDAESLAEDWPYFVEVELRSPKHKNWEQIKDSKIYDPNAVAVYAGPLKMTYKLENYELFETATEWRVARQLDLEKEAVMADYLQGLIEAFHQTKLDLSDDEISEEDLDVLRSLGYVQ